MSVKYRNASGQETIIAGLTPGGDIEAGAVMTRSGVKTVGAVAVGDSGITQITFDEPMPDTDYDIIVYPFEIADRKISCYPNYKTTTYFNVIYSNMGSTALTNFRIEWKVFKTYTVQHAQQNAESIATIEAMVPAGAGSSNKLVTASQLTNVENSLDGRLDAVEDVIPATASITNQLVTAQQLEVIENAAAVSYDNTDSGLTADDVQEAIDELADMDNTPTQNSTKAVKSGGIYTAFQKENYTRSQMGAKNLIKPSEVGVITKKGITFTQNADGTVSVSGTATDTATYSVGTLKVFQGERYTLSGGLNDDADSGTQRLWGTSSTAFPLSHRLSTVDTAYSASTQNALADETISIDIQIFVGKTYNGETFYPMVRLASDIDDTFTTYAPSNKVLMETDNNLLDNINNIKEHENTYGVKNLLPMYSIAQKSVGGTTVVFESGKITVTGNVTLSANVDYTFCSNLEVKPGTYKFNGCPEGGSSNTYYLKYYKNGTVSSTIDDGSDPDGITIEVEENDVLSFSIYVKSGTILSSDLVFYPMLREATNEDSIFKHFSLSNEQITKYLEIGDCQGGPAMPALLGKDLHFTILAFDNHYADGVTIGYKSFCHIVLARSSKGVNALCDAYNNIVYFNDSSVQDNNITISMTGTRVVNIKVSDGSYRFGYAIYT